MGFDPFLYLALGFGLIAGRLISWRSPWVERATFGTIVLLLLLLGATLGSVSPSQIVGAIPLALAFLVLGAALTLAFVRALRRPTPAPVPPRGARTRRSAIVLVFGASVVVGYLTLGRVSLPWDTPLEWVLYVLLALVAFDLKLSWTELRHLWVPLSAAVGAALVTGIVMTLLVGVPVAVAFATPLGFGWYTLAGPLVAAKAGAALGLVTFLANFLRESLTMVSAPQVGARLGGDGITALGGATSMDTTLYFAERYGGAGAGGVALATGLVLTITAGVVLPVLLSLPGT